VNDSFKVMDCISLVNTPIPKCVQYWIAMTGGLIDHPEPRQLITQIDTLELLKGSIKQSIRLLAGMMFLMYPGHTLLVMALQQNMHTFVIVLYL